MLDAKTLLRSAAAAIAALASLALCAQSVPGKRSEPSATSRSVQRPLPKRFAQPDPSVMPLGLSVVWRLPGRRVARGTTGSALNAYSPNGRYVAVYDAFRVRVLEAVTGETVRDERLDPSSIVPFSLAVSSSAKIALGRMGNAMVLEPGKPPVRHWCVGACGVLTAVAFSPDERFLAYQGTRGFPDWRSGVPGVISVVDLATGAPVNLEAAASIAQVAFSADGRSLAAMNVTQVDDHETFGVRVWSTDDWSTTRTLAGSKRAMRRVAPLGEVPYAGVAMNADRIEARDLADDRVIWSVPLVPPDREGAAPGDTNLDLVEIAPTGAFVLSYEASKAYDPSGTKTGTLVIRRAADGAVEALYDVPRVSDITIAPDGKTFVYSTAAGDTYTAVARVPF